MFVLLPLTILLSSTTVDAGSFCLDNHDWSIIDLAPTNNAVCIQRYRRYNNWSPENDYMSCNWGGLISNTWNHCFDYPEFLIFGGVTNNYGNGFMVSINGDDGFWIDQAFYMNDGGTQIKTWGEDHDQKGWCLSSDNNDRWYIGDHLTEYRCCRTWYFSDNGQVYGCFDDKVFGRRLEERLEHGNLVEVPAAPKSAFKHIFGA